MAEIDIISDVITKQNFDISEMIEKLKNPKSLCIYDLAVIYQHNNPESNVVLIRDMGSHDYEYHVKLYDEEDLEKNHGVCELKDIENGFNLEPKICIEATYYQSYTVYNEALYKCLAGLKQDKEEDCKCPKCKTLFLGTDE